MSENIENFNHLYKKPYQMKPECFSCILNVSIQFITEGLQLKKDGKKLEFFNKRILENMDENTREIITQKITQLESNIEEKKEIEQEGVKELVKELGELLDYPYPVILASSMFNKVKEITQNDDPWTDLKAISTLICLNVEDEVRDYIFDIEDQKERLRTSIIFSALANTIDFGTAMHNVELKFDFNYLLNELNQFEEKGFAIDDFDILYQKLLEFSMQEDIDLEKTEVIEKELESEEIIPPNLEKIDENYEEIKIKSNDIDSDSSDYDDILNTEEKEEPENYESDRKINFEEVGLEPVVLILCDNAGEIVFDKILAEVLTEMGISVVAVVKGAPISNDATIEDAKEIDFESVCPVITTGSADLGFNPYNASKQFLNLLDTTPIIIAKGQANFESINTFREAIMNPDLFLLAKFKCLCNATIAGVNVGDYVFWKMQ